ncbi:MAG: AI-2E family transporter [Acaryochloris sp. RU_4_1]|nr:AI-2E family transporter [Acaryochloris sp. SU_5_25]NJM65668.1 AI-2E family transporter [Acaryochloris sp. RU_4_1]NJN37736.1 AI-2E family transporter [Acaryochloridaceae cyanobacterium CSU_3_4]NJR54566.1 AI-2E family transporter [Acaryochloris sp. CRU_2_0]
MSLGKWIGLVVFLVSIYILWEIRQVLLLGFTAVVLASALNGLVRQLTKRGIRRGFAVALAIFAIIGVTGLIGLLVIPPFVAQAQQLFELAPRSLTRIEELIEDAQKTGLAFGLPSAGIEIPVDSLIENMREKIPAFAESLLDNFFALFSNSLLVALNILLILVLTIMFLVDPDQYRRMFIRLFPAFYRRRVDYILGLCDAALDNWILGILFNMTVIAVCSGLGLWALGVKLVLANALIAGLLEAIPNIGPTLSLIPPMAIALLDSPLKAVLVLALYILIQQLEQYLLVPAVMAKQLSLAPAITLLSQIVFALFFGFLGLLLALPLLVIGQIWVKEVLVKDILDRWNHSPLTRTPVLASEGVAIPNDSQGSMTSDLPTVTPPKEESS